MDSQKVREFEDKVGQAFFFACRYGIHRYFNENNNKNVVDEQRFYILCNEGFKIAQSLVLQELQLLQVEYKNLQSELKNVRKGRLKQEEKQLLEDIKFNKYKNDIFRLIIFSIVWQIFNGRREYIVKFYIEDEGEKNLIDESFEAVIREANKLNEKAESFCLICDLTSNIQVGDLLIVSPNGYEIKEIKTGKKNEVALNLLEFYKHNAIELDDKRMSKSFDKKFIDQLKRVKNQTDRIDRVKNIISNDKSKDIKTGQIDNVLIDTKYYNQKYYDVLINMIEKTKKEKFAYDCLEGIVHIGVYREDWRARGEGILTILNKHYPVFDLMWGRGITICEPIFLKPFNDDTIMDLLMGRIRIMIGVDYEEFIQFCNLLGMNARWSTPREFQKIIKQIPMKSKAFFSHKNKGIIIEEKSQEQNFAFVGQGLFAQIIFDHIYPSSIILNRLGVFDNLRDKLRDDIII